MRYLRTEAERVSRKSEHREFSFATALLSELTLICALGLLGAIGVALLGIRIKATNGAVGVMLIALFSASQAAMQLVIYHHQAHLEFVKAGAINIVRSLVLVIVALLVIAGLTRSGMATATILTVVSVFAAVGSAARLVRTPLRHFRPRNLIMGTEAAWLTIFFLASAGFATVDVFIVAALLNQQDVAAFGVAQRYYALALGVAPALLAVVRVRSSQSDVIDSSAAQMKLLHSWIRRMGVPAVVGTLMFALAAPIAMPIVNGGHYPTAIPVFQLLLIGVCAYYVCMPASSLLMAQGRYRALAIAVLCAFTANAVGDVLAVKWLGFGIVGIATVASVASLGFSVNTMVLAMQGSWGRHIEDSIETS